MKKLRVLSEDGGKDAYAVVCCVTRQILRFVLPGRDLRPILFLPLNEKASLAVHGNIWKSRKPRDRQKRLDLMEALVGDVLSGGFVVFHIDADQIWARRQQCLNLTQFADFVAEMCRNYSDARFPNRTPERLREAFERRLIVIVPYYSIESWLYQSTERAVAICDEQYRGKDRGHFAAWGQDRRLLDEEPQPKDRFALGDRHNRELAEAGIPVHGLEEAGKSFAQAVARFRACSELLEP